MYAELNYKKTLILSLCFIKCVVLGAAAQQLPTLELQGQRAWRQGVWRTTEGVAHLTLEDVIFTAQNQSIAAMTAKYTFLSSYWSYRSHKASLMLKIYYLTIVAMGIQ